MKKSIIFFMLLFIPLLNYGQDRENMPMSLEGQIIIDSIKVEDSINIGNLTIRYKDTRLLFGGLDKSTQDYIYSYLFISDAISEIGAKKENIIRKYDKEFFLSDMSEWKNNFYEWCRNNVVEESETQFKHLEMKIFSNLNHFLILYGSIETYDGGAPSYELNYKILDKYSTQKVLLSDILDYSDYKQEIQKIIAAQGRKENHYLRNKTIIPISENFYFDENNIIFAYQTYEIAPYDAGVITISVPYSQLIRFLKPSFKLRMKLRSE